MAVAFDVVYGEKYTDRNNQEKTKWTKIGRVVETKNGGYALRVDVVPVGWDGSALLMEPKQEEQQAAATRQSNQQQGFQQRQPNQFQKPRQAMGESGPAVLDNDIPW